jgi:hypothetical protein
LRGPPWSLLFLTELSSRLKERFWAPVCAKSLRFLHLLKRGNMVPRTITSTANGINNHEVQLLAGAVGVVSAAAGVLAVAAGVAAAVVGVTTVSADVLAVTSGAVAAAAAAAGFADSPR